MSWPVAHQGYTQSAFDLVQCSQQARAASLLTVIAPCNWLHVATWSELFPRMDLAVIEPWPDLLSTLMDAGCFLHLLPPGSLVLCAGSHFRSWPKLYAERIQKRAQADRKSMLFVPPRVANLPEVTNLQDIVLALQ